MCQTSLQPGATLAELALEYVRNCRRVRNEEFDLYREQPTLRNAIMKAAASRKADGTLHTHQRTASSRSLDALEASLIEIEATIARCQSFSELHTLVQRSARGVRGIGDVTVYDVALRIGMWQGLRLEPEAVYLHSRTHDGMKALGMERKGRTMPPSAFPPEFAPLRPREIEDLLCAFRELLPKVV